MAAPQPFPTGTLIIPSGTTVTTLVTGQPAQIANILNAAATASIGVSIYNSATVGGIGAANRILNAALLPASTPVALNVYCSAGIVIQFASATADNITVTWHGLINAA